MDFTTILPDINSSLRILGITTFLGILAFLTSVLTRIIYNIFFHPLRHYPGPISHAATDLPLVYQSVTGNRPFYVAALHAKYGPVVRVSPDQLAYTSGAAWRDIYGHTPGKAQLPKHSQTFTPRGKKDLPNGILTANDKDHARYRKLLAHAFSAKALEEQEPLIMGFVNLLIRRLGERAEDGPQNMVAWYNFTTFDLIGDLAFGEPFDCLAKGEYHSWVSAIFATIKFSVWMNNFRRLGLAPLVVLFVPRSAREARKRHFANARAKVVARLERGTERPDFMSYILRNQGKEGELTVDEMVANASTMIGAGSETTATLLSGATYYLAANPGEMAKVVAEVRGAFQSDGEISLEGVNKLEYLLAVLNESLRIYPPVPTSVPRVVNTKGGRMIAGQWVPEGTSVGVYQWANTHSPDNFHDPDSFIPERWLKDPDPKYASDKLDAINPFSAGPRNCIGKNLAFAEMRLILAKVLWNFDLMLENESRDWADQRIYALWEKKPLMMTLRPRKV